MAALFKLPECHVALNIDVKGSAALSTPFSTSDQERCKNRVARHTRINTKDGRLATELGVVSAVFITDARRWPG